MSNLPLEKRILYSTVYCAYREYRETKVICHHTRSFGICDLDVCPIVQTPFASIVFQQDGIYLMIKRPSEDSIIGKWDKIKIDINIDDPEETIRFVEENIKDVSQKNREYLLRKINNIIERYKFLRSKGKSIPIIEEEALPIEEEIKETVAPESELEGLEELEKIDESPKEEIEELELLDFDEIEEDKK